MFISQHILQMNSNYNNVALIVSLKLNPYGNDLCLVRFFVCYSTAMKFLNRHISRVNDFS